MRGSRVAALACLAFALSASGSPWRFGIVADTQWPDAGDSTNPNLVGAGVIRQVDSIFVARKVDFVVALGDQADYGYALSMDTRASAAQDLYDAGIGFFPVRGNHEGFDFSAAEFLKVYPQTRDGWMNRTPAECRVRIPGFRSRTGALPSDSFRIGTAFTCPSGAGCGLSYSFRYRNATFVLLDQFYAPDGSLLLASGQLHWISGVLSGRPTGSHAFVMAHEGLIMPAHADGLLGSDPSQDSASTRTLIQAMASTGARWFLNGHDHIHSRSVLEAPGDSGSRIQDITCASAAYKFHFAQVPSNDELFDIPAFGRARERILAQEAGRIGIYVVTVDGDEVDAEHIAADPGSGGADLSRTPDLTGRWSLRESFGYSLAGAEFLEPRGRSLAGRATTSRGGLRARILGGGADRVSAPDGRPYWRQVGLSWSTDSSGREFLRLRGLPPRIGDPVSPPFALGLQWPSGSVEAGRILSRGFGLARPDGRGGWDNAVSTNSDGNPSFHVRPWTAADPIGAWGIDTAAREAWAVVDRDGAFAVVDGLPEPGAKPGSTDGKPRFRQVGGLIVLPSEFAGRPLRVDYRAFDGSFLARRLGSGPSSPIPEGIHRPAIAELRVAGEAVVRGFVFLP